MVRALFMAKLLISLNITGKKKSVVVYIALVGKRATYINKTHKVFGLFNLCMTKRYMNSIPVFWSRCISILICDSTKVFLKG